MEFDVANERLNAAIAKDKEVVATILFGSYARSEPNRDINLCLVLNKKLPNILMSKKRLKYSSLFPNKFDINIFQQLPLYIRKRVLKEGKVLLCKDENQLYDIAFSTLKEFDMYKKIYYNYLVQCKKKINQINSWKSIQSKTMLSRQQHHYGKANIPSQKSYERLSLSVQKEIFHELKLRG